MSSYFKVRLFDISPIIEDVATSVAFDFGATGLSEALAFIQPDLTYEPDILKVKTHDVDVFFPTRPDEKFFEELKKISPLLKYSVTEEETKDWLAEWKKGFVPFQLVGPYWVVPSWHASPVEPQFTISIDPGMAFGTGTHATTKMASYFVHKVCSKIPNPETKSLIDVGTGTAILAMLAFHHKIGQVTGVEIDPEARRVARENVALNKMESIKVPESLIEEVRETFDIVVANIIDGVLIQIKPYLLRVLKPQGDLFLTGILLEREDHFIENFIDGTDLKVVRRIEEDEWVGYWLKG